MNVMLSPFKVAVVPEDTVNTHQLMVSHLILARPNSGSHGSHVT